MKRREFIRRAAPVSVLPLFMGGFTFRAYGRSPLLDALTAVTTETDHVLVFIQLNGGNDGLNTVIPLDQYSALMAARGNIAIDESKVLKLSDATGLHPAMTGLHSLYNRMELCIVQGVGYPNPNFSHFRATDIWLSASDSDQTLASGWMGRYLDQEYPDYPNGYPNAVAPDPLAIQIGSVVSQGLQGPAVSMGMAITSPGSFYQLVTGGVDTAPNTPAGHELTFLREVAQQTQEYAVSIQAAASAGRNLSGMYPAAGQNSLADQLKIVAQLISGGLKTRLYVVNLGGFDTHSAQVDTTAGTDAGTHAKLLGKLSEAISAFQDDVEQLGVFSRVVGMTFSEFGRRIVSNASAGTDHGTAAPLFIFGTNVHRHIVGANPVLPVSPGVGDNLEMQNDFRSVYASLLVQWLGVPKTEMEAVLQRDFPMLPLIIGAPSDTNGGRKPDPLHPPGGATEALGSDASPTGVFLGQNFPNPFNPTTELTFSSDGGHVLIQVFDVLGREVGRLADGVYPQGVHSVRFDAKDLPAGAYYYRMRSGEFQDIRKMVLAR